MNYDPNLTLSGRMATQTVRLTFGQWEYRKTMDVRVGGNCRGFAVIGGAVEIARDKLDGRITLKNTDGDELTCEDDDDDPDWLEDMLLNAQIISIEQEV